MTIFTLATLPSLYPEAYGVAMLKKWRGFLFSLRGLGCLWLGVFGGLLAFNRSIMDDPMVRVFLGARGRNIIFLV